jgi:hypothetical protein
VARVNDDFLYLKDIDSTLFISSVSHEDSARILNIFIDHWIQQRLLIKEAEKYTVDNDKINRLVDEYRKSLILQQYENALVKSKLDSAVTQKDIQSYYASHKNEYTLNETLIRAYYMKIPNNTRGLDDIKKLWHTGDPDFHTLMVYANTYKSSIQYYLDENKWLKYDYLAANLPKQAVTEISNGTRNYVSDDGNFTYLLKVFEVANQGNTAPISYVQHEIADVILYQKRKELIENASRELFDKAKNNNKIEVYIK